jgi:hypothetical protein
MRCVPSHHFTVAKARAWRSSIEVEPPYQRESGAWSLDKQQLFIDSLLNGYDVPKVYLHDLRGSHPTKVYAIVDGKQRLTTTWSFLDDDFPLAADFRIEGDNPDVSPDAVTPVGGMRFSQLDPEWQRLLTGTYLSVVLIRDADEEDIEDLFSRLNNGEALNAAERRNALGGDMVRLVRDVARRPFFAERLPFSTARHQHLALAAGLLALAATERAGTSDLPDLSDAGLDGFVRANRNLAAADQVALSEVLDAHLDGLARVFGPADRLLGSPEQALIHCAFAISALGSEEPSESNAARVRAFLDDCSEATQRGLDEPRTMERRLAALHAAYGRA